MNDIDNAAQLNQAVRAMLKDLQGRFPVFQECRPLAIGIDKQVRAALPENELRLLRRVLALHTHSTPYLKAMAQAKVRYNLDGSEAGEVPEEHRSHASETLKERFKKQAEKRKAEMVQKRETERRNEKLAALADKFKRK